MRKVSAICAILAFIMIYGVNRPNYDSFYNTSPTPIHAMAISCNNELKNNQNQDFKFNKFKLTEKQIDNFIKDAQKKEKIKQEKYQKDVDLLSQVIYAEAGSDDIPDKVQFMVANVVLNRVDSNKYFPNTIYDVIHAPNQYQFIRDNIKIVPNQRAINNAKKVLNGYRILPKNVLFQTEHIEGDGIYTTYKTNYSTTYFCYKN